jgi:hypothetical protein
VTVFVSYSSRDRGAVKSLTQDLQDADEQVWMDQRLAGGDAWWRAILEQIRGCDVFIFALSQNSIESKPCQAELQYAQALGLPTLPVQVGPVDSMSLNPLATVQAIDYRHQTPNTGMRLITALNRERAQRQPLPSPLPDGTVILTSPSGQTHVTTPGSALLFPNLCAPTGALDPVPTRLRCVDGCDASTRAQNRASYIAIETVVCLPPNSFVLDR